MSLAPPPGFARHFRQSPLTDPWEPLWSMRDGEAFVLALEIAAPHTNARGMAHGGLIAALADNDWFAKLVASGFAVGQPVPIFPRLELPEGEGEGEA